MLYRLTAEATTEDQPSKLAWPGGVALAVAIVVVVALVLVAVCWLLNDSDRARRLRRLIREIRRPRGPCGPAE